MPDFREGQEISIVTDSSVDLPAAETARLAGC
jgi:hypothetical protein